MLIGVRLFQRLARCDKESQCYRGDSYIIIFDVEMVENRWIWIDIKLELKVQRNGF